MRWQAARLEIFPERLWLHEWMQESQRAVHRSKKEMVLRKKEIAGLLCVAVATDKIYTLTVCSKNKSVIALISGQSHH